ncbi:MAG TPA: nucleoside-diphosphate sugar epimerase/dehydratase [Gemmatimonadales bacterium]|nr:nucleoside-diphosphate sugar epimerase/dehydratase [Gemmatimonadales bacterium]
MPLPRNGLRNRHLLALDLVLLPLATWLAFVIRFEGFGWIAAYRETAATFAATSLPLKIGVLLGFGLYRRLWRFASVSELEAILSAAAASGTACFLLGALALPGLGITPLRVPLSVLVLDALLTGALFATPRLGVRALRWHRNGSRNGGGQTRVLIAGAGTEGGILAKRIRSNPALGLVPVGFVDDDPAKQRHRLHGLPVLGRLADTARLCRDYHVAEVLIAMPNAPGPVVRALVQAAQQAAVRTRTLPGISDILSGRFDPSALRPVEIQDLLRREPVRTNLDQVKRLAAGQTVLVTGAGGSIGSELCRQLCQLGPSRLVLLGHGENSIFAIHQELAARFPHLPLHPVIADVRDSDALARVFERYEPSSVFHAAAHKHVPLMEENVAEAISNNVLGTRNVVELAAEGAVERLVLISTDKAVRPTSVMGATKRVAEQIVQHAAEEWHRNFVSVRFGNVLGSRGSVVPTFLRQIAEGGPVTVTHPEMRRYFMTIPEAVQLVLQAGALGRGGEVFVLDMGEPVRIADLAADLIRLSGKRVGKDIEIRFTGPRPGEKLYEELFFSAENAAPTDHPKVLRARNAGLPVGVTAVVSDLIAAAREGWRDEELRALLRRLVPDYEPAAAGAPVAPPVPVASGAERVTGAA